MEMYGKSYQAETILRKKKRRPFAKEILKEVNDNEDLFKVLFTDKIKDIKQKVKQDPKQSNQPRKNKGRHKPCFLGILEQPEGESIDTSDFLDPFDALLKDKRNHVEKKKIVGDSPSKLAHTIHEDEKENSPEVHNSLSQDDKNKRVFFESVSQGSQKNITVKPTLKLTKYRKGSRLSVKTKEKLNPRLDNSCIDLIDSSWDPDTLENQFKAKREELRKKKEEFNATPLSKNWLGRASEGEVYGKETCSRSDSHSVCKHPYSSNQCYEGKRSIVSFVSSTPAKSEIKQTKVNVVKHRHKGECNGSELGHQLSTSDKLPCFLSPILSVTEQKNRKSNNGQDHDNICKFGPLRLSSEKNENQRNIKYWKKMYEKLNPVPVAVEKVTVLPYIHAYDENSSNENTFEMVESFPDQKENVRHLNQSPDPFANSDVLHEQVESSYIGKDYLVEGKFKPEEVNKLSSNFCEKNESEYSHRGQNSLPVEPDPIHEAHLQRHWIIDETSLSQKDCSVTSKTELEEGFKHSGNNCEHLTEYSHSGQNNVPPGSDSIHGVFSRRNSIIGETNLTKNDGSEKFETELKEVIEHSSSNCEHGNEYSHSGENNVPQRIMCLRNLIDRMNSLDDSIIDETDQSKNNYMSNIAEEYIGGINSQNSLKENCPYLPDSTISPTLKNVCFERRFKWLFYSMSEVKRNTSRVVNDSNQSLKSEIDESVVLLNCSDSYAKLNPRERIPETKEVCSQDGSLSELTSKLSLSGTRCTFKSMKRKSFAPRRSHLVVPLAQNDFKRESDFREVYMGIPLRRGCVDKNLSVLQPDENTDSISKYDNSANDLDEGERDGGVTIKDVVLAHCRQTDVLAFDKAFSDSDLVDCKKIGEGVYGEVFARLNAQKQPTVMKIMPIEGDCEINGESQKSFEEILPEIVISAQLSKLRENENFSTPNFPELIDCWCVQGKYPPRLMELWQEYDENKTSENDSPDILPEDQIYIILELSNVGSTLESFTFNSAEQSWSAFMQVTYTLAVAEASLEFEHRDLHWGNILIKRTTDKTIRCKMYGEDHVVPTQGIQASVIDFTLSRITYDGCCIYNNLAEDPAIFEGQGDYQFDIYRMMREQTKNNWQVFQPYNNVLWLSYVLEKLITESYYRNEKSKIHKRGSAKLKDMRNRILDFKTATEVALSFS